MNADQIKHMVDRFLGWRLPENFNPDCGISFKKMFNEHTAHPAKYEPTGTNLLDATQAEAMVRHMVEGLPQTVADAIAKIPPRMQWLIGSGRTRPSEPLYAVQLIDPESGIAVVETEAEQLVDAINAAVKRLPEES